MAEITLIIAFFAGLISFLSPCVLPLIPAYLTFLAGTSAEELKKSNAAIRTRIFLNTVFFVLGFSLIFSLVGVILQQPSIQSIAFDVQIYLGYIGGSLIIFFGLILMGLIKIPYLQSTHKLNVSRIRFKYLSSFIFGAAFAVGWTPCVGAVLGGVLTLAITVPGAALPLMLSYSLGLGVPFLLTGLFISRAQGAIKWILPHLKFLNLFFGAVLVLLGILVFTGNLPLIANLEFAAGMLS
ncbi:MAG TPA: cytochrome c biogenesis protein CcdA [archaeon]|nr:cytochrome c biogenesis protein CcdA [archaeon]